MNRTLIASILFSISSISSISHAVIYRISHYINKAGHHVYLFSDYHRDYFHNTISLNHHAQFLEAAKKHDAYVIAEDGHYYEGNNEELKKYIANEIYDNVRLKNAIPKLDAITRNQVGWSLGMAEIVHDCKKEKLAAESAEYRLCTYAFEKGFKITGQDMLNELATTLKDITSYKYQEDDQVKVVYDYHAAVVKTATEQLAALQDVYNYTKNDNELCAYYQAVIRLLSNIVDSKIINGIYKNKASNKTTFIWSGGLHTEAVEKFLPQIGYTEQKTTGPSLQTTTFNNPAWPNSAKEKAFIDATTKLFPTFFSLKTEEPKKSSSAEKVETKAVQEKESSISSACASCSKTNQKLLTCSRCKQTKYCSHLCQRTHWEKHKLLCKAAA
jgi:hypothetical protein